MHKKYIYPLTSTAYGEGDEGELYQRNDGSADNTLPRPPPPGIDYMASHPPGKVVIEMLQLRSV